MASRLALSANRQLPDELLTATCRRFPRQQRLPASSSVRPHTPHSMTRASRTMGSYTRSYMSVYSGEAYKGENSSTCSLHAACSSHFSLIHARRAKHSTARPLLRLARFSLFRTEYALFQPTQLQLNPRGAAQAPRSQKSPRAVPWLNPRTPYALPSPQPSQSRISPHVPTPRSQLTLPTSLSAPSSATLPLLRRCWSAYTIHCIAHSHLTSMSSIM